MQKPASTQSAPAPAAASSRETRLSTRETFFKQVRVAAILRAFDEVPGLLYVVKDRESRVMAISPESVKRMGYGSEEEIIGQTVHEYLPGELADKFLADDHWVLAHGEPRREMTELWFSPEGERDWIVTSKYPLHDEEGKIVGVIGILQNLKLRQDHLAGFGPVGKAVDFIRARLGEELSVAGIARASGLSERQLQRLFRRLLGQSIRQYLIKSRTHAAAHALAYSEHNLTEIALMFGFNDQSSFSHAFRRIMGQSPRAYRRQRAMKSA